MFYFIGGAPRSGKTILAKKLSKDMGVPWISADSLESIASQYVSTEEFNKLFPKSKIRKETGGGNDLMYSKYTSQDIADAYINQAKATWRALEVFIECEDVYGHDYILEGHQIHPEFVRRISNKFPSKIKVVFLGRSDIDTIVKSASENSIPGDWFTEKTKDKSTYPKIAEMITIYSSYFEKQAKKDFPYFNMDQDFSKQLNKAEQALVK